MKFEQFTEEIINKIKEFLPEKFNNASVELQTITKNNDMKLTALKISCADSNICPVIYLEQFYEKYQSGEDINNILSNIADIRIRNEIKNSFDIEQLIDFERVKDLIVPKLINKDWNKSLLEQKPHKIIADLAVTYHIILIQDINTTGSIPITYDLMQTWEIDIDTIHKLALNNMPIQFPSTFRSMSSVLKEKIYKTNKDIDDESVEKLLEDMAPQNDLMYILSNKKEINGATALLDKEIMQEIIEKLGEEFYIIPSSIHECIIVSSDNNMDKSQLTTIIQEVNTSNVDINERLSNHPYKYTIKEGIISI